MLPRDAFFAPKETVSARHAIGRIAAEQVTPYPPGIGTEVADTPISHWRPDPARRGPALPIPEKHVTSPSVPARTCATAQVVVTARCTRKSWLW
jgi:hypothetical protein